MNPLRSRQFCRPTLRRHCSMRRTFIVQSPQRWLRCISGLQLCNHRLCPLVQGPRSSSTPLSLLVPRVQISFKMLRKQPRNSLLFNSFNQYNTVQTTRPTPATYSLRRNDKESVQPHLPQAIDRTAHGDPCRHGRHKQRSFAWLTQQAITVGSYQSLIENS